MFHAIVTILIVANLVLCVLQTQIFPDSSASKIFKSIQRALTLGFSIQLIITVMVSDLRTEFLPSILNWFKLVFCVSSFITIWLKPFNAVNKEPWARVAREAHNIQASRHVKSSPDTRTCYHCYAAANALGMVLLIYSIFAMLGVSLFHETDPEDFGDLATAMSTLNTFLTFDKSNNITLLVTSRERSLFEQLGAALYMISFQIVMTCTLMNIGLVVLLEEFAEPSKGGQKEHVELQSCQTTRDQFNYLPSRFQPQMSVTDSRETLEMELDDLFGIIEGGGPWLVDVATRNRLSRTDQALLEHHERDCLDMVLGALETRILDLDRRLESVECLATLWATDNVPHGPTATL